MDLTELRGHRVGLFASGGLSATAVGAFLAEAGLDVVHYVADIGQTAPLTPAGTADALTRLGHRVRPVDLRVPMAEMAVDLIAAQATYGAGYWNTTSASRFVLVRGLVETMLADGCAILAHGCVGGGNDQTRFSRYAAALAPGVPVLIPWTTPWLLDRFPDRTAMATYLRDLGYPDEIAAAEDYSIDANLAGVSHESTDLESLATPPTAVAPLMTVWPADGADKPEQLTIRFADGRPVEIDGRPVETLRAMETVNAAGARHGISLRSIVENRVNGTKCRGVYESPGMDILGTGVAALIQVCLDKPTTALMRTMSEAVSTAVYEGRILEPTHGTAASAAGRIAAALGGQVELELYKGHVTVQRLTELTEQPGAARQTRFAHGGHHWQVG
jgi:argininosuccinate synthase